MYAAPPHGTAALASHTLEQGKDVHVKGMCVHTLTG